MNIRERMIRRRMRKRKLGGSRDKQIKDLEGKGEGEGGGKE